MESEVNRLFGFLDKLRKESDRGAVLISAAILDEQLKDILKAFLTNSKSSNELLESSNAPLGTFSSRINSCYSLGLIQKNEFEELNTIRKIRNEFAHKWNDADFTTPKIKDLTMNLPWTGPSKTDLEKNPKERFNFMVVMLLTDLLWRVRLVEQEKRVDRIWPNKGRDED